MALSLYQQAEYAENDGFRRRLRVALVAKAIEVLATEGPTEGEDSKVTARRGLRQAYARKILHAAESGPRAHEGWLEDWAWAVAGRPQVAALTDVQPESQPTDSVLKAIVDVGWSPLAGVSLD